jgi:LAS superfamily LD-carboxypeptidase LdcB
VPYPVVEVKYCSHLAGKKPSEVTPDILRKTVSGGKMELCAADAWDAMVAAAAKDGVTLKPTSLGDQFRSIEQQKAAFLQRYRKEPVANSTSRTWNGQKWWLKKGLAPLAAPNDDPKTCSRHMLGLAVDVANASGKILEWLLANENKFGFSHEVQSEPWHIRYVAGDDVPAAVKEFVEQPK